jgi:hypothetical protein
MPKTCARDYLALLIGYPAGWIGKKVEMRIKINFVTE